MKLFNVVLSTIFFLSKDVKKQKKENASFCNIT